MRNLDEYSIRCMNELDAIGIRYGKILEVKTNIRAKKRWGQCRVVPGGYSININAALLDERNEEKGLMETIIHELLHTCVGCMQHGENWKRLAEKVNMAYGYNIKRCNSADEKGVHYEEETVKKNTTNYIVKCEMCGHEYKRTRKSKVVKYPTRYRCGICGGSLSLK